MLGKLRIVLSLVAMLSITNFGWAQQVASVSLKAEKTTKEVKKAEAPLQNNEIETETNISYNTDLYDAISPGFQMECPKVKKKLKSTTVKEFEQYDEDYARLRQRKNLSKKE